MITRTDGKRVLNSYEAKFYVNRWIVLTQQIKKMESKGKKG